MKRIENITIVGPAYPYRGGLAAILQSVAREFMSRGAKLVLRTFTLQYPSFLFPGESQTVDGEPPADIDIIRSVNTVNPFNWIKVGLQIRSERPDVVILKYWTPFMAPAFGTICRLARSNGHTKVICHIDNVEPHEHHIIDKPCNSYFLSSVDGFVYMSEQVHQELKAYSSAPTIFSPHPMFDNFGSRVEREIACQALNLDQKSRYALFFGLIRGYKGLDMLFDAWADLKRAGKTEGRKLIVAGEFYTSSAPYYEQLKELNIEDDVVMHDHFIADDDVANYFSACDFIVLPYRTASQSGVTQIAYNFSMPLIVTKVGGLPEIVPDNKVGYCCEPSPQGVAAAIETIWSGDNLSRFEENMKEERKRFTWAAMCDKIEELYYEL